MALMKVMHSNIFDVDFVTLVNSSLFEKTLSKSALFELTSSSQLVLHLYQNENENQILFQSPVTTDLQFGDKKL